MMSSIDPAVSMARRALFKNNPIYQESQIFDDSGVKHHAVKCTECGRVMRSKGSKLKLIDGHKRYLCLDCYSMLYQEED